MQGYWQDGKYILASTQQDKIAALEARCRELEAQARRESKAVVDIAGKLAAAEARCRELKDANDLRDACCRQEDRADRISVVADALAVEKES